MTNWFNKVAMKKADDEEVEPQCMKKDHQRRFRRYESYSTIETKKHGSKCDRGVDKIITNTLATGRTFVDLSYLELIEVPKSIEQLRSIKRLNLALYANLLHRMPSQLFSLSNLTLLNLWKNKLTRIPQEIKYLTGLEWLNVGLNELKWIPMEVTLLPRLTSFQSFPNPFDMSYHHSVAPPDMIQHAKTPFSLIELAARVLLSRSDDILLAAKCPPSLVVEFTRALKLERKCAHCHHYFLNPFSTALAYQSICDADIVPVLYPLCSSSCHLLFNPE